MLGDPAIKQALAQLDSLNGIYPVNCFIHDTPNGVSTYGISLQFPWGFPPGYVPGISPYQEGAWLCIDTDDTLKSAQIQFDGTTIQCR
jgi:hypothetical protein